jgi:hypothetical protein
MNLALIMTNVQAQRYIYWLDEVQHDQVGLSTST